MSKKIPGERLIELKKSLEFYPARSPERINLIKSFANLYDVSKSSVYRQLRELFKPKSIKRSDSGKSRIIPLHEMEKYCQLIAAMKIRTLNKKGHHLSTVESIRILEESGIGTSEGLIKAPKSILKRPTVNRYLNLWGYNFRSLQIEPAAVRFQAKHANDCWQFDLSPSDLKKMKEWPKWVDQKSGRPLLMLYSVVDDRSGVAYQEYHAVFGEDVESALRFLFKAMSPKKDIEGFPFQGIPHMIYMDNGPIAKSQLFQRVMEYLGIDIRTHMPKNKDGRRTTARAKGKVERPFRTVKEIHETLYHFNRPNNVDEANSWLINYILRYNEKDHRSENHSRIEDWIKNVSPSGIQKMCSWERFCTFAREPEKRKVGSDARIDVNGGLYQVSHELAGKEVILWWGLFDMELFVENGEDRYGPYLPVSGPIPLHKYRSFKKTHVEKIADKIEDLAKEIYLPKEAMTADTRTYEALKRHLSEDTIFEEFEDPDPFNEFTYLNKIEAKKAISDYLGIPLAKLDRIQLDRINEILENSLNKKEVIDQIRAYFRSNKGGLHAT